MKTAVEWLHELSKQRELDKFDWQQAKAMEKQQIMDAHKHGGFDRFSSNPIYRYKTSEQYYNKTFKSE